MDLKKIAKKMIDSKFTVSEDKPFIDTDEGVLYGMSIRRYIKDGYFIDCEDLKFYNVFRGYFNPIERLNDDEDYMVLIVTDLQKKNILCSLIYINEDCCTDKHRVINFNLNVKK